MNDSLNNKELVAVGHQFAKVMSSDTPIIDMAKIVSRLAERLDCTTAALREMTKQRDALAAENAGLKECTVNHAHAVEHWNSWADAEDKIPPVPETPATDSILAEVRAQALTNYADKRGFSFQHGSIHAHFGNGDVLVGATKFENGHAGICFAPVREKEGGVGTEYKWTEGKNTEEVSAVFVISSSSAEGLEVIQGKLSEAIAQLRKGAAQ